ncbi:MAG: OadG family protein [Butyrivibrio sp.]|nr:OadG family protein [Butyrivibrio sp.]
MKSKLLILGLSLTCLLGLSGCGSTSNSVSLEDTKLGKQGLTEDIMLQYADNIENNFEYFYSMGANGENFEDLLYTTITSNSSEESYELYKSSYSSWYDAIDDIGYTSAETVANDINVKAITYTIDDETVIVEATLEGAPVEDAHSAILEYTMEKDGSLSNIAINVNYSFGESMARAGLNTLLGMGMAFFVLIIVSLVISLFPLINKLTAKKETKNNDKVIVQQAMENVTTQIAEKEELADDLELVAVISAAIAAYEGTSSEGFQVRSIRRVNKSNWKKA